MLARRRCAPPWWTNAPLLRRTAARCASSSPQQASTAPLAAPALPALVAAFHLGRLWEPRTGTSPSPPSLPTRPAVPAPVPRPAHTAVQHALPAFFAWPHPALALCEKGAGSCRQWGCVPGRCRTLDARLAGAGVPAALDASLTRVFLHRLEVQGVDQLRGEALGVLLMQRLPECLTVPVFLQGHGVQQGQAVAVLHACHGTQLLTPRELNELWLYHKSLFRVARGMRASNARMEKNDRGAMFFMAVPLRTPGAAAQEDDGPGLYSPLPRHHTCAQSPWRAPQRPCDGGVAMDAARALVHSFSHPGALGNFLDAGPRVHLPCVELRSDNALHAITDITDFTLGELMARAGGRGGATGAVEKAPPVHKGEGRGEGEGEVVPSARRRGRPAPSEEGEGSEGLAWERAMASWLHSWAWFRLAPPSSPPPPGQSKKGTPCPHVFPCLECASLDSVLCDGEPLSGLRGDDRLAQVAPSRLLVSRKMQVPCLPSSNRKHPCTLVRPGPTALVVGRCAHVLAVSPATVTLMGMAPSVMWRMEHQAASLELSLQLRRDHGLYVAPDALATALTGGFACAGVDMERLEFLGDGVLRLLLTLHVLLTTSGALAQPVELLQRNSSLCSVAARLPLAGRVLHTPLKMVRSVVPGFLPVRPADEPGTWKQIHTKLLADTVESAVGAVFRSQPSHNAGLRSAVALLPLWFGLDMAGGLDAPLPALAPNLSHRSPALPLFQRAFGYTFRSPALLHVALDWTARGEEDGDGRAGAVSASRLSALGDAVITALVTIDLTRSCARFAESELTNVRQSLMCNSYLGTCLARRMWGSNKDFSSRTLLSQCIVVTAEQRAALLGLENGWTRWWEDATLYHSDKETNAPPSYSNAYRAIVGAMFVDSAWDLDGLWRVLKGDLHAPKIFGEALDNVFAAEHGAAGNAPQTPSAAKAEPDCDLLKNPISRVHELAVKHKLDVAIKATMESEAPPWFRATCTVRGEVFEGAGRKKQLARVNACTPAVARILELIEKGEVGSE